MESNHITYCDLELISPDEWASAQATPASKNWLRAALKYIANLLVDNSEPRIWITRDRDGVTRWHLYALSIGQTMTFESEYEVLAWLDNPYHR